MEIAEISKQNTSEVSGQKDFDIANKETPSQVDQGKVGWFFWVYGRGDNSIWYAR